MKENADALTVPFDEIEAALDAGVTRLHVPDATSLEVFERRAVTWLSLAGSPIEHDQLRHLARCPLEHLDLSRTALVALEPIRRTLERREDDMTARMVVAEVWAERYEFRWDVPEGDGEDFWVADDEPSDAPIPALSAEDLVEVDVPVGERMAALVQAAELYDLDLRALHGPLTGLAHLPRTLRSLALVGAPVSNEELVHLEALPQLRLLNLALTAVARAPSSPSLRALDLSGTSARGPYPPNLRGLRLGRGQFDRLALPQGLESLAVVDATLGPDSLTGLPDSLRQLTLYRCELVSAGTWALGGLAEVDLTRCRLSAADRVGLGSLGGLERLTLSRTDLAVEDLPLLAGLVGLAKLSIGFMDIEPAELEKLHAMLPGTQVELAYVSGGGVAEPPRVHRTGSTRGRPTGSI